MYGQDFKYIKAELDDSCEIIKTVIDTVNYYEQIIYIDHKRNSKDKNALRRFDVKQSDYFIETYDEIVKRSDINFKRLNHGLPDNWLRIRKYKGDWILYNDIEFNDRFILSDTAFISFNMDGQTAFPFSAFNRQKNTYSFAYLTIDYAKDNTLTSVKIDIELIDKKHNVYLWRFNKNNRISYWTMIPERFIYNFPIVGIKTTDVIGDEIDIFDEVNFERFIKE